MFSNSFWSGKDKKMTLRKNAVNVGAIKSNM